MEALLGDRKSCKVAYSNVQCSISEIAMKRLSGGEGNGPAAELKALEHTSSGEMYLCDGDCIVVTANWQLQHTASLRASVVEHLDLVVKSLELSKCARAWTPSWLSACLGQGPR
jgi:hypothetical protein